MDKVKFRPAQREDIPSLVWMIQVKSCMPDFHSFIIQYCFICHQLLAEEEKEPQGRKIGEKGSTQLSFRFPEYSCLTELRYMWFWN